MSTACRYTVAWYIDIESEDISTPLQAAESAARIARTLDIQDPEGACVFHVAPSGSEESDRLIAAIQLAEEVDLAITPASEYPRRMMDYDWTQILLSMGASLTTLLVQDHEVSFHLPEFGCVRIHEDGGQVNVTFEPPRAAPVRKAAGAEVASFRLPESIAYWDNRLPGGAIDETIFAARLLGAFRGAGDA